MSEKSEARILISLLLIRRKTWLLYSFKHLRVVGFTASKIHVTCQRISHNFRYSLCTVCTSCVHSTRTFSYINTARQIHYDQWSPSWRSSLDEMDPEILLAHDLSRIHLELRMSTVPGCGLGVFKTTPIWKGAVIRYYYGTLVYENMGIGSSKRPPLYGKGTFAVQVTDFATWALNCIAKHRLIILYGFNPHRFVGCG